MELITIIFIGIGLAMDCFAVSITSGMILKEIKVKQAMLIAFFFGFFQAIMPVLGWLAGLGFKSVIENYDHWIAFGVLLFLGIKMIYEDLKRKEDDKRFNPLNLIVLLTLSVATSIDAMAVGVTFAFLNISVLYSVIIIGLITILVSLFGLYAGAKFGDKFNFKAEIFGGIILILIGLKILLSHTIFS